MAERGKSTISLVEVHARELGIVHKVWGNAGWRTIHRVVTATGSHPEYEDLETGQIKAGGRVWPVWKRSEATSWTTSYEAATRYARLKPSIYDDDAEVPVTHA